jgi:hypothetical protein
MEIQIVKLCYTERIQHKKSPILIFMLLLSTLSTYVKADDNVQFHGFISQGFIYTTDNEIYGNSTSGNFKFSEVGANISKRFSPKWRFTSQIISRATGQPNDWNLNLDYFVVDYKTPLNDSTQLGFRAGRVKNVLGFYNETRDVAFTRSSIFAPQSIYFDFVRDLQLSSDGIIGYGDWLLDSGTLKLEVGTGYARINGLAEKAILQNDFDGYFHNEKVYQARVSYTLNNPSWRFALSSVDVELNYLAGEFTPFSSGKINVDLDVLSVEYSGEFNIFTAEYMQLDTAFQLPPIFTNTQKSQSWYLQGQHKINDTWSAYLRYEEFYPNKNDKNGVLLNQMSGLPKHFAFAKHTLLGLKCTPKLNWILMMEVQNIEGTATIDRTNNPNLLDTQKYWQMFSLMLSYKF